MAYGRKRKGGTKAAASTASKVARSSALVERKKKRSAASSAARQLALTPIAKQLIRREIKPHRDVKHFSFGVSFVINEMAMAAGATTNVFNIVPFLARGVGDDEILGNRCRLLRYVVRVYARQSEKYKPDPYADPARPSGVRMRYMFVQPKEAPNVDTFTGATKNKFRDQFLESDDQFRDYNGSLTHLRDKHNPAVVTLHKQFYREMNFTIPHDTIEAGPYTTVTQHHEITWVHKPARKILQFLPNAGGAMYPENFDPQLVVLCNRTDLPFANYSQTDPIINLAVVCELDFEDIE